MRTLPRKRFTTAVAEATGEERAVPGETLWWPAPALSGIPVTPQTALTLTAFYGAVNVLATDVAILPLNVYRKRPDGSRDPVPDDPRDEMLSLSPDRETTAIKWRQSWMAHALMWEGGYGEIQRLGNGKPHAIHLLDPSTTRAKRKDGRLGYAIEGGTRWLPALDVLHIASIGYDGISGWNLVKVGREALGLALAAQASGASFYGNGSQLGGILKSPKKLGDLARKNLREDWDDMHRGPTKSHRPALLEEGVEFQPITIDPEKAQALETRKFQNLEVGRPYRVPPHKNGDFSQAHLANIEASNLDYLMTGLMSWLVAIEQECNLKLFTPAERKQGLFVEHNVLALLRADMKARGEFYKVLRELGAINPNEIRRKENMNPIGPRGDLYVVQSQYVPLDQLGMTPDPTKAGPNPVPEPPKPAPDQVEGEDDDAEPSLDKSGPPTDTERAAERPGEWLDGNQMFSLKRIVNDVAAGELPTDAAKAMILASFPGMEEDQIDRMLDPLGTFTPKSLAPQG